MKKRILIILIVAAVVGTAATITISRGRAGTAAGVTADAQGASGGHGSANSVIEGLQTTPVAVEAVGAVLTVTGDVQPDADRSAKVGSPVSGRLTSLTVKVGDYVRKGQTLAVVASRDAGDIQAALTRARAEEIAAQRRLETVRAMAAAGSYGKKPLEDAQAAYTGAMASVQQAEAEASSARSTREQAASELERKKKLAAANAYQARPVEEAKGEVARAQAELETAQSSVKVKQAAYDRAKRLLDHGIVARRELENAENELDTAKAQEREARTHLDLARQALTREESIAGQGLHTSGEIQAAQTALRQAEQDVARADAEVNRARGHLTAAESALAREKHIAGKDLLTRRELQEAETNLTLAQAQVKASEQALASLKAVGGAKAGEAAGLPITAPISGVVTERAATQGQTVDTMTDMLTIVATDRVWVVGNAYEKDLSRVRKGQKAIVRVTGLDGKSFTGTVTHVSTVLDTATRTAKVRCEVQNPGGQLRPGMFANVDLVSEARGSAILIPKAAVMDDAGKNIVFVACMECEEDKVAGTNACGAYDKMEVQVGPVRDERIEILGGLTPGMEVVTTGQFQLKTALGSGQLKAGCTDH